MPLIPLVYSGPMVLRTFLVEYYRYFYKKELQLMLRLLFLHITETENGKLKTESFL